MLAPISTSTFGPVTCYFHAEALLIWCRGTLPYMAPELVSDPERVSEKADVWSLGMVLWEMLTRQVPFTHLTPQQIIAGLMVGNLQPEVGDTMTRFAASLYQGQIFLKARSLMLPNSSNMTKAPLWEPLTA